MSMSDGRSNAEGQEASHSAVVALINQIDFEDDDDNGDRINALETATHNVVNYLRGGGRESDGTSGNTREKVEERVNSLWDCEKFFPFILESLSTNERNLRLHYNALWILEHLIIYTRNPRYLSGIEKRSLIQMLFRFLRSPHRILTEQAVSILAHLSKNREFRVQLLTYASNLFPIVSKLLANAKENPPKHPKFNAKVSALIRGILIAPEDILDKFLRLLSDVRQRQLTPEQQEMTAIATVDTVLRANPGIKRHIPTLENVFAAVQMIEVLLEEKDNQVIMDMLFCVAISMRIFLDASIFTDLQKDVCLQVVSLFSRVDEENVLSFAATTVGYLCHGMENLRTFLSSVKRSEGLRHYWKILNCIRSNSDETADLKQSISNFLNGITQILVKPPDSNLVPVINSLIASGALETFSHCLEPTVPQDIQWYGATALYLIFTKIPPSKRQKLVNAGWLKVSDLVAIINTPLELEPGHGFVATAVLTLGFAVEDCSSRRDEAISLGTMKRLLDLLSKWRADKDNKPATYTLYTISKIMEVKPKPALEILLGFPAAIRQYWKEMVISPNDKNNEGRYAVPTNCLAIIASYGIQGIDCVLREEELLPKIIKFLRSKNTDIQDAGMKAVFEICKGTKDHRWLVLEAGVLKEFLRVLKSDTVATRKMALECLYGFLTERTLLSLDQKVFIRNSLWSFVQDEVKKDNVETNLISTFLNVEIRDLFLKKRNYLLP